MKDSHCPLSEGQEFSRRVASRFCASFPLVGCVGEAYAPMQSGHVLLRMCNWQILKYIYMYICVCIYVNIYMYIYVGIFISHICKGPYISHICKVPYNWSQTTRPYESCKNIQGLVPPKCFFKAGTSVVLAKHFRPTISVGWKCKSQLLI